VFVAAAEADEKTANCPAVVVDWTRQKHDFGTSVAEITVRNQLAEPVALASCGHI
jgi:hypothetical protein